MAAYFFDTSALVKRCRSEQGTDAVDAIFAEPNALSSYPVWDLSKQFLRWQ
jgi:hypothetical protein